MVWGYPGGGDMHKGFRYLDADAHVLEPESLWGRYLDPDFRDEMPRHRCGYYHAKLPPAGAETTGLPPFVPGDEKDPLAFVDEIYVGGYAMPEFLAGRCAPTPDLGEIYGRYALDGFGPGSYKDFLSRSGVDYMAVYPTTGLYTIGVPSLSARTAAAIRRAENRWLNDFRREVGPQMIGVGTIDLRDPVEAALEARHCVRDYGFRGVFTVPEPVNEYPLFHPFYDPFWAELQDLDVPMAFHPTAGSYLPEPGDTVLTGWTGGRGVTTFVMGSMLASIQMVGGGVLERFPRLKVAHFEIGVGWVHYWMDRMQAGIQGSGRRLGAQALPKLSMLPVEYFQRQCFVGADPDDPALEHMVKVMGDDSVVPATDFGHPEGRYHMDAIEDMLALDGVSDDTKRKIMWSNPARLYGMEA